MRSELDVFPLRHRIFLVKHYYQAMGDLLSVKCQYEDHYSTTIAPKFSNEALVEVIEMFENTGSVKRLGDEQGINPFLIFEEDPVPCPQSPTLSSQTTETVHTDEHSDFAENTSNAETLSNEEIPHSYDSDTETWQQKEVQEWWSNQDDSVQMEDVTWNRWLSSDENVCPDSEGQGSGRDFTFDCLHPNCSKSFVSFTAFNLHRLSHIKTQDQTVKCGNCDKIFLKKFDLKKHFRHKHIPVRYKCKICGCAFRDDSNYFSHLDDHEHEQRIFEPSGSKSSKSSRQIINKTKEVKASLPQSYQNYQEVSTVCGKFVGKYVFEKHMKSHEKSVEKYKCPALNCNKSYCSAKYLKRHMIRHSTLRYKCDICSLEYKDIQCLRKHIEKVHLKKDAQYRRNDLRVMNNIEVPLIRERDSKTKN
ncbi:hypothetical protein DMENIID0001_091000 [Sergentomyia squamirostris]